MEQVRDSFNAPAECELATSELGANDRLEASGGASQPFPRGKRIPVC
jgi:hypothetical protein